ncbi:eukaryotic translation initiation factor 3 subunit L-like [Halichondria panicea]|uniref:eukaryotic translation initiation factor 3 subunit L-like n=1 Tax=Halichondria panicea TaxID=6063 RepID=UPI00312B8BE3
MEQPPTEYFYPAQQPGVYGMPPPPVPGYMAPPIIMGPGIMYPPPGQFYPQGAPPMEPVPMTSSDGISDNPDNYIPDVIKAFIPFFHAQVIEKNVDEILRIYEEEFGKLSTRFFTEAPWPRAELIAPLVKGDEMFLALYKEMQFRHIYAKFKPTVEQRMESFQNYINLFNIILGSKEPVDLEIPNQWLWDIIDEFIYQFQSYVMFRGKLKSRSSEEIQLLKDNPKVWSVHGVLNVLYALVDKSNINKQLEAYYAGEEPSSVAGDLGNLSLYKNLGYFSLIGLLRLHTQLGDYYQALQAVANVQLSKKVLATTRVPASQISLYYYVGFCFLMMRRYKDTLRTFSNIIVFIQRAKNHFQPKSYQQLQVIKQNEQMLNIIAMVVALNPQHVDEVVNSQLRGDKFAEKIMSLSKGELKTFEEMFFFACPKFMSPIPPDYESLPENYNKQPTEHQCDVFKAEIEQQLVLPKLRSYLKFYTTMPISKLSAFMEVDEATLQEHLLCFKHKTRCLVSTSKGTQHLAGEVQSISDLDFYIDGEMLHIADTKMARRYGDFFIRQIHKLEEICSK